MEVYILNKKAQVSHTFVFVHMREFIGYHILYSERFETKEIAVKLLTEIINILSGTHVTMRQGDLASPCNISHFDGIESAEADSDHKSSKSLLQYPHPSHQDLTYPSTDSLFISFVVVVFL